MMIRKPNFFVIGCLLALPLVHPLSAQERSETKTAKHSLWKLEGERSTVYLLGSVHLLKKEDYPLPSPIEAAFTNAQIVVFETDQEKMQAQETQMKLMSKAQLPAGQTLRQ